MSTEKELREALLEVCDRARDEAGVRFNRLRKMLGEQTAQATAEKLLGPWKNNRPPRGFQRIMEEGRPDLTLEHVALQERFRDRFDAEQLGEARRRLGLRRIAREISLGAIGRPIGGLQRQRSERQRLTMVPSLFDGRTIKEEEGYAFHVGGLAELQFNIGFETASGEELFRHGVAFSLQPTQTVPDIRVLIPRIRKFIEFLRTYPEEYADLSMWHFTSEGRSDNYTPGPIPDQLLKAKTFIFLGTLQPARQIDIDRVLDDFDRLMPLYDYVEGDELFPALTRPPRKGFVWSPGNKARPPRRTVRRTAQTVDSAHRHNILQDALFKYLEKLHGEDETSGEQENGNGKPVDVAVRTRDGYIYYEIKTALTAQLCIREALGQLMEYSYWPDAQQAEKLVVVGEGIFDEGAQIYLNTLRKKFSLPLEYQQFDTKKCKLVA